MKKYKYLLFDADETLFDFKKAEHEAFHMTLDHVNLPFSEENYQAYSEINDKLWKRLERKEVTMPELKIARFREFLGFIGVPETDREETAAAMRDNYVEYLALQSFLIDGAEEVCRTLAAKYPIYIVTNGISRIQRARLEKSPIKPYVTEMFVSEEIGVSKPEKAYFDHVLRKIGDPDTTKYLVIGDSLTSDMKGALDFGLDACFFNPKGITTDLPVAYTVKKLQALYAIL